jgi:hypothetical protein
VVATVPHYQFPGEGREAQEGFPNLLRGSMGGSGALRVQPECVFAPFLIVSGDGGPYEV